MHGDNVAKAHAQVMPDDLVHAHFVRVTILLSQDDADSVLALLALRTRSLLLVVRDHGARGGSARSACRRHASEGVSLVVGYNTAYVSVEYDAMQSGLDTQPTQRRPEREADLEQDGVAAEEL